MKKIICDYCGEEIIPVYKERRPYIDIFVNGYPKDFCSEECYLRYTLGETSETRNYYLKQKTK